MDVRCPKCSSLFELDERQMRGAQATLQCSVCSHLFRVRSSSVLSITNQRWMVRSHTTGDVRYVQDFQELHRLLMIRQVAQGDFLSRTGKRWVRLSDMGELMPVFQTLESISLIEQSRGDMSGMGLGNSPSFAEQGLGHAPSHVEPEPPRVPMQTIQQFAVPPPSQVPAHAPAAASQPFPLEHLSPPAHTGPHPAHEPVYDPGYDPGMEPGYAPAPYATGQHHAHTPQPVPHPTGPQHAPQRTFEEPPEADEAASWSMGPVNIPAHEERETRTSGIHRAQPPRRRSPARAIFAGVFLAICILAAAGVGWKMTHAPGTTPGKAHTTAGKTPNNTSGATASKQSDPPAIGAARAGLYTAFGAANAIARQQHLTAFTGAIKEAKGKLSAASEAAEKRQRRKRRASVKTLLKRARIARRSGDTERAFALYDQVLDRQPRNAAAIAGQGWVKIREQKPRDAAVLFEGALNADPNHGDAYIGLGTASRQLNRKAQAINAYREYLRRFPDGRDAAGARHHLKRLERK